MKQLNEILRLRREINELRERLFELKQMTQPKAQTISDMPRGGERKNAIEEYIVKSDELQKKLTRKNHLIGVKWELCKEAFKECELSKEQIHMLHSRFYRALPWKKCAELMSEAFPETTWPEQKLFRMYRKALHSLSKYEW